MQIYLFFNLFFLLLQYLFGNIYLLNVNNINNQYQPFIPLILMIFIFCINRNH